MNWGLCREPGKRRTSTSVPTPASRTTDTSSSADRVPCPIVQTFTRQACQRLFGVVGEGLGFAIGYATLTGRGITYALNSGQTTLLVLGSLAGVALFGAFGVGIGVIVRNQVGAIIGLLAWAFVAENLLFAFVPSVGRFTPGNAANALIGLTSKHLLPAAAGGAILLAWTTAFALTGTALAARRDVT